MKRLAILGCTGSIGRAALEVAAADPGRFQVAALAAGRNLSLLSHQIRCVRPSVVVVQRAEDRAPLAALLDGFGEVPRILCGEEGLLTVVEEPGVDLVVNALVGGVGLGPTLAALERGLVVALANKEALCMGGELCVAAARRGHGVLLPVDSEPSALFQCLHGRPQSEVRRLFITASGGPFRDGPADLSAVTAAQALMHPTWVMGPKVSVDSATLMNKGLEVIEAHVFFGVPPERIEVLIHPESAVHGLVELCDGALLAQLGPTDMRIPISLALSYPERRPAPFQVLDLCALGRLTFEPPDRRRFPCLDLAYEALRRGGTAGAVLSAADEVAVQAFLDGRLGFMRIPWVIEQTLAAHHPSPADDLATVQGADDWARRFADDLARREPHR